MKILKHRHPERHRHALVWSAASLSRPSWVWIQTEAEAENKKKQTFHIPENTSTIQQLQTLTKSIIVRHKGRQARTHTLDTHAHKDCIPKKNKNKKQIKTH